ncbi:beta-galactosidase [Massilia sp. YIM B02787]|uniref:Beta-galactosidase n=1 Tax=Massilia orientalis TaxID=3050128 RepID=A0ACC7MK61_9BURK|nr:beta-galactosidase [Massilia sp. YIM B02787]
MIVDGKPYLILGGELHNSSASSAEYMASIWPRLKQMNLNTVLSTVSWDMVEPKEGRYDFGSLDRQLDTARARPAPRDRLVRRQQECTVDVYARTGAARHRPVRAQPPTAPSPNS